MPANALDLVGQVLRELEKGLTGSQNLSIRLKELSSTVKHHLHVAVPVDAESLDLFDKLLTQYDWNVLRDRYFKLDSNQKHNWLRLRYDMSTGYSEYTLQEVKQINPLTLRSYHGPLLEQHLPNYKDYSEELAAFDFVRISFPKSEDNKLFYHLDLMRTDDDLLYLLFTAKREGEAKGPGPNYPAPCCHAKVVEAVRRCQPTYFAELCQEGMVNPHQETSENVLSSTLPQNVQKRFDELEMAYEKADLDGPNCWKPDFTSFQEYEFSPSSDNASATLRTKIQDYHIFPSERKGTE